MLTRVAGDIAEAARLGVKIGVVTGGGNIYRGMSIQKAGGNRVAGDQNDNGRCRHVCRNFLGNCPVRKTGKPSLGVLGYGT